MSNCTSLYKYKTYRTLKENVSLWIIREKKQPNKLCRYGRCWCINSQASCNLSVLKVRRLFVFSPCFACAFMAWDSSGWNIKYSQEKLELLNLLQVSFLFLSALIIYFIIHTYLIPITKLPEFKQWLRLLKTKRCWKTVSRKQCSFLNAWTSGCMHNPGNWKPLK